MKYVFRNLFLNSKYSLPSMIAFTTDLIGRMSANNPDNVLDGQIVALQDALAILHQQADADFAMLGIRKGRKLRKDNFRAALPAAIHRIYSVVHAVFGDPSEEMRTIFPKGRSIFQQARDDSLTSPLNTLISGLDLYEVELGDSVVADATALRDEWLDIYEASESATGVKTATEAERREARYNLAVELHRTVGILISLFPEDQDRYSLYMKQYLLGGPPESSPPASGGGSDGGIDDDGGEGSEGSTSVGSTSAGSSSSVGSSSIGSSSIGSSSIGSSNVGGSASVSASTSGSNSSVGSAASSSAASSSSEGSSSSN